MRLTWIILPVLAAGLIASGLFLHSSLTSAVHSPVLSIDMDPTGNTYTEANNSMTVGTIEQGSTSAVANPATHIHNVHIVIQNVEDLVGWQARMNYTGDEMRPSTVNFTPFSDGTTGQSISFLNIPLDGGIHRDLVTATDIPPGAAGPQTALIGSVYNGAQTDPVSPDTPDKAPPDDASYTTTGGGVLASLNLQVVGDQTGQASLFMNLDDADPNSPGSDLQIWTGTGLATESLATTSLGDGYHGEGTTVVPLDCVNNPCPGQVATPTQPPDTPTPSATATAAATPGPGVPTPTPTPGGPGGTGGATATRTPAAGAGARTPTPRVTPAALPPTGGADSTATTVAYLAVFVAGTAAACSGTAYAIRRLRRDEAS